MAEYRMESGRMVIVDSSDRLEEIREATRQRQIERAQAHNKGKNK